MQAVLVMFRSDGERRSFSVTRDMTVIGRREDCDLRIPLGDISRKHARLVRDGDVLRLEDLGSSNGTFLNGQRVQEAVLSPGDSVQLGPVVFVLQIDGTPGDDDLHPVIAETATHASPEPMPAETGPLSPTAQSEVEEFADLQPMPSMEDEAANSMPDLEPMAEMEEVEPPTIVAPSPKLAAAVKPPAPAKVVDDSPLELEPMESMQESPHGDLLGSFGNEAEMELVPEPEEIPEIPPMHKSSHAAESHAAKAPPVANGEGEFDLEALPELADDETLELLPDEPDHVGHDGPMDLDFGLDSHPHPHA